MPPALPDQFPPWDELAHPLNVARLVEVAQ